MSGPALCATDVRVRAGRHQILRGVDLHLDPGEWVGLIGPNGAGKSTLLHALAATRPFEGAVTVGGRRPSARDIAVVAQSPTLPVGMTVAEYTLIGRTAHLGWLARESARDRDIVAAVLSRLDLDGFADRDLGGLSGGEAQRVVIARALAQQTPIVLLDEPTSALDLGHQTAVLELVDELRREDSLGVIAAMHELGTAARFADRLVLLSEGQIVADGPPREVLDEGLLADVYGTRVRVHEVEGELVVLPATGRVREVIT